MLFLDSSICIGLMRGNLPSAYQLMKDSDPRQFKIPAIVASELYFGAENSPNPSKYHMLTERFLQPFEIVPFDDLCARAYAGVRHQLKEKGKPLGPNDMLIAATALAHQATLATNDNGFCQVPGLKVENWAEVGL